MLLENRKYGIIKRVTLQQLETLENTYNFEVEDSLGKENFGVEKYFSNKNVSGMVKSRYADVVQLNSNGEVIKIFQVGKVGASGMPVLRESVALADLALATGGNIPIIFVPYNVPLPPIIFP